LKSAIDLIREEIGVTTREEENPEVAALGAASVVFLRENANRVFFLIINLSANPAYVRPGLAATAAAGIYLGPNGGMVAFNVKDDKTIPTREWWGTTPAGASNIYVLELVTSR